MLGHLLQSEKEIIVFCTSYYKGRNKLLGSLRQHIPYLGILYQYIIQSDMKICQFQWGLEQKKSSKAGSDCDVCCSDSWIIRTSTPSGFLVMLSDYHVSQPNTPRNRVLPITWIIMEETPELHMRPQSWPIL